MTEAELGEECLKIIPYWIECFVICFIFIRPLENTHATLERDKQLETRRVQWLYNDDI